MLVVMGLFGKEQIRMMLEKYDYKAGDKVKGKIILDLKKPVNARKLEIALVGRRIDKQTNMAVGPMILNSKKEYGSQTQYTTIYNFKIPLDGEKEYQLGEYSFEIKIPENIHQNNPSLGGKLGKATNALKMLSGLSSRVEWHIKAQLDVPKKFDINKTQEIVIS